MHQKSDCFAADRHVLEDGSLFFTGELPAELRWDTPNFDDAWALHPIEKHRIQIHGREVETPRWQQAFGADYYYSGKFNKSLPIPDMLLPLFSWVHTAIDHRQNGILINWYDGPKHYIGPHHDSVKNIVDDTPIVTISFGETRVFRLSRGKSPARIVHDFPTLHGTVFVMPYATNLSWKHEVKKSVRYTGRRISVTFRAFTEAMCDGGATKTR